MSHLKSESSALHTCVRPWAEMQNTFLFVEGEVGDVDLANAVNFSWGIPGGGPSVIYFCLCVKSVNRTSLAISDAVRKK